MPGSDTSNSACARRGPRQSWVKQLSRRSVDSQPGRHVSPVPERRGEHHDPVICVQRGSVEKSDSSTQPRSASPTKWASSITYNEYSSSIRFGSSRRCAASFSEVMRTAEGGSGSGRPSGPASSAWPTIVDSRRSRSRRSSRPRLCVGTTTHAEPAPLATCAATMYCAINVVPALVGKDNTSRRTSGSGGFGVPLSRSSCGGQSDSTGGSPRVIALAAADGTVSGRRAQTDVVPRSSAMSCRCAATHRDSRSAWA